MQRRFARSHTHVQDTIPKRSQNRLLGWGSTCRLFPVQAAAPWSVVCINIYGHGVGMSLLRQHTQIVNNSPLTHSQTKINLTYFVDWHGEAHPHTVMQRRLARSHACRTRTRNETKTDCPLGGQQVDDLPPKPRSLFLSFV